MGLWAGFISCSDPELPSANTTNLSTPFTANFTFANATVDAPTLDCAVNGIKIGGTTALGGTNLGYTALPITSAGYTGTATANTSIRARDVNGSFIIKPSGADVSTDLIYRSTNNGINNFVAITGMSYTIFAIDSINRAVPQRLNRKTATISFADVTYFNPMTKKQISASRRDSIVAGTTVPPPAANEAANLLTIGLIPLGITDPGGVRFYVVQDQFLSATTLSPSSATNAGIRFVNTVANANGITAGADPNGITPGGPPLFVRLRPAAGATIPLSAGTTHVVTQAVLNPTVGSRTLTTNPPTVLAPNFTSQVIAAASIPIAYTLEVSATAAYTVILYSAAVSFNPGKHYTVFVRGIAGKTDTKGLSHGIITY